MGSLIKTNLDSFELERVDEIDSSTDYHQVKAAIADIKNELVKNGDLVSLCAPQVGHNLRLFVVRTADRSFKAFLNPLIVNSEGMHLSRENNASLPDKTYIIPRRNKIHLAYQDPKGHVLSETYIGAYAEVIQQMVEFLDGILLSDYGLEIDKAFDRAKKSDKEKIISMYLESLKLDSNTLNKEINEDPQLKNINDTINFMTGMLTGDITPVKNDSEVTEESN